MTLAKKYPIEVNVFPSRAEMGQAAGKAVEMKMMELLRLQPGIRIIFAAAPSQNELLDYLAMSAKIDWGRITAFNMDEYIGLDKDAPQLFSRYLNDRLFDKVDGGNVRLIDTTGGLDKEIDSYAALIAAAPIDIVCLGIGENGHIAFNDPPVADFNDSLIIKEVQLDEACRLQQVNEGCFERLEDVPGTALTLTIPTIMNAKHLYCVVPGISKREAVFNTLNLPVDETCPATILREHPDCRFFFDEEAYPIEPM